MPQYLIEVPHENSKDACERAVKVFRETGSHFMTASYWGCADDEHKAWIIVELDSKAQAQSMLPPLFRQTAKIVRLQTLGPGSLEDTVDLHAK